MRIPKKYRVVAYIGVLALALVLFALAVISPEHFQRATSAIGPILAVVGSVLALLHLSPDTSPPVAAEDVDAGDVVEVVPAAEMASDPQSDAAAL